MFLKSLGYATAPNSRQKKLEIMPKKLPEATVEHIAGVISKYPKGIGVDALQHEFAGAISRRSLQRRLNELIHAKRIVPQGKGPSRLYRPLVSPEAQVRPPAGRLQIESQAPRVEIYIPLSPQGKEIRDYVRQPVQLRKPVGYNREFIESYRPNETFYLGPEIRAHLHRIGRPSGAERPAGTYAREIMNRLLIDLSWASSRLEGNTYTQLDTQNLIEFGRAAEGKD